MATRDELVADRKWEELAALGAVGRDAMLDRLRYIAALDPGPRIRRRPGDEDPLATWPLVSALAGFHDPTVSEVFIAVLATLAGTEDPLCTTLLQGLAECGTADATAELVDLALHDRQFTSSKGSYAAMMLGSHPSAGTLPALVPHLADTDPQARLVVARIVGEVGDAAALDPLIALLDDPDSDVRAAAADALGRLHDERALLPLLVAEERDRRTRRGGYGAIGITGKPSPLLAAVDEVLTGERIVEVGGWRRRDPFEIDADLQSRTADVRDRYATQVDAALVDEPQPTQAPWTVAALTEVLIAANRAAAHEESGAVRYNSKADFDRDVRRCEALGCEVGKSSEGDAWEDPMGGEAWWTTVMIPCADGTLRLAVVEGSSTAY